MLPDEPQTRVAILTGASLSWNPRALKEAQSLSRAGLKTTVYGASGDREQQRTDEALAKEKGFSFRSVVQASGDDLKSRLLSTWRRTRTRIGCEFNRYLDIEHAWQLGTSGVELAKVAAKDRADYYIAHLEQGAWAGVRLRRRGFKVGIDMEDWYSEDLPPSARKIRPIRLLRSLERELLCTGMHSTCPSRAMSQSLAREFECHEPTVVYNAFPWSDRRATDGLFKDRTDINLPSIHWVSQTIGQDRGLDDLLSALPLLKHRAEIHLRGRATKGLHAWFYGRIPEGWRQRVVIHDVVSNAELLSRISEHDIGLATEIPGIRNKDLTVSNKILHYLLAGLAVVATETAGQREVAAQAPGGILLYQSGNAGALAALLNRLLASRDALAMAKRRSLDAAERTFCWEVQENTLLRSLECALGATQFYR
jgi:glycosyltransferase involved in cell wall biosynthesis